MYFFVELDVSVLWVVFLVYAVVILTYGIGISMLSEYITNKIKWKGVRFFSNFFIHLIFGTIFFLGEFIIIYGLTASIIFFISDELLRYKQNTKVDLN